MNRRSLLSALTAVALAAPSGGARAQSVYRVVGVRMNDVLNIREFPNPQARILEVIPPDARGITVTERRGDWVFVQFNRVEGWAHGRFLEEETGPVRRGRRLD